MTAADFRRWLHDPALAWYNQHPVAHAAGGLVFLIAAAADLVVVRAGLWPEALVMLAAQVLAGVPIVARENQQRPMQPRLIAAPLGLTCGLAALLGFLLPAAWTAWVGASGAQLTWELLQRSAWVDAQGRSTYPWYSVLLDWGTASLVAAIPTFLYWRFA